MRKFVDSSRRPRLSDLVGVHDHAYDNDDDYDYDDVHVPSDGIDGVENSWLEV